MSDFIGRQIDAAVAVEDVRGVAETTASKTIRKVTANLIPQAERVTDDTTFGRLEDAERVRTVRKWSEGDIEGIAHADSIGYFLSNVYGEVDSESLGSGVYKHTFNLEQTIAHPTLTMFIKDADVRQEKIANTVVSELSVNVATDDYVRFSASFLGKEGESDSSELPALTADNDWISRDATVKIATTEGGLTSASALPLKTLELTINTNAEADWVFGDRSPNNIHNRQLSIEGNFTKSFMDEVFKDLYEGDEFRYMLIEIEGEEGIGGGENPTLKFVLNKIQVTDWERTSAGDDLSEETVNFKAFFNTTDEKQSEVELINKTEEYVLES